MEKAWLAQYPKGVPAEIDLREYTSLVDVLERSCEKFATLPACSNLGHTISFRELDQLSRAFAAYLQCELRLTKGERVAIMMPNLLQYPVALFGLLRAGLTVVNVNPMYTPRELEYQLCNSGASVILVLETAAHTLEQVIRNTQIKAVITTRVGDLLPAPKALLVNLGVRYLKHMVPRWRIPGAIPFTTALRIGRTHTLENVHLSHEDVAFLQYTGGTTGVAKGAVLSHGNMVANLQQLGAWSESSLRDGKETAILPLPLYHIYGLTLCLGFVRIGAHSVLITNPRDLPSFVATLKKTPVTIFVGVNTLYRSLLDTPGFSKLKLSQLRFCLAGGMAVQRAVAQRWKAVTGMPLMEGYGLSETSPSVTANRPDIEDWTGSIGLPLPSTEIAILDPSGNPVPAGEVAEICVRGPQVMKGYWNMPDETRKAFTSDGWFRTGDMGSMDERGYVKLTDRKKDMIVVSGFKVFPNEVEDVVMMHPGVLEVGAIGVPDERSGECVKLIVVKKDQNLTEQALLEHCRKHLTSYKIPKAIEFRVEPLPKTPIGKILRRQLRADFGARKPAPHSSELRAH